MKKIYILIVMLTQLFLVESSYAQYCGNAASNLAITPTTTNQVSPIYTSGRRAFRFAATAGCTYYFETCGLATQDTYLRLYSTGTGGTVLATGDDNCGTQSAITWTCVTSGTYSILLTRYLCNNLSASNTQLRYRITSCGGTPYNPCTTIPTIAGCGTSASATMTGTGAGWSVTSCGWATPGQERLFQFTAPTTGTYTLNVSAITGGYVDFFWKPASGGCNATGWNCIDDIFGTGVYSAITPMTFTAGTTYYILLDPEGTGTYNTTFNLVCPAPAVANDLVCNATAISCGQTLNGTTVGANNAGTGENLTCGTGQTMPGVWYVVPGNGQIMTASLCGTVWDSKISVFNGTNCAALTCVGGNDDAGPACATASASFSWTSVVGQNYYILVHGFSTNQAFSLALTCTAPPPADPTGINSSNASICSGAGTNVTLTAAGAVGTVYWFAGSCATTGQIATGNSISVSPSSTTTYFARNFNGSAFSTNCASYTLNVVATPTINAGTGSTICEGNLAQLNATSQTQSNGTLNTIFIGGNGCGAGNMFDLVAGPAPVTVNGFSLNPSVTGAQTVNVYYRVGTHVGNTTNIAAWTLLGAYTLNGTAATASYMATGNIVIPAGATYGIYVQYNANYTDGNGTNQTYSNANLTLNAGVGHCTGFDGCCAPRVFNGIVHYTVDATPTISWSPSASLSSSSILNPVATPATTTTYTVTATANGCSASSNVTVTIEAASTAPTLSGAGIICPNTTVNLVASGGTAGAGSQVAWYTGPNGTGSFLGFGNSFSFVPTASSIVYARREGTCNTTADASTSITIRDYVYAANNISSTNYCTDNSGWNHFYNGNDIIFSVEGDLSGAPLGYPIATINNNSAFYQETEGPGTAPGCVNNENPNEERFEMSRSWNLDFGGGTQNGTYKIRFYYPPAEKTAIENAANAWMANYVFCSYDYKYPSEPFYWFKNTASNYTAPDYDGDHYSATVSSTNSGINYSEWNNITSFSGGSGAIIVLPTNTPLPVELVDFWSSCMDSDVAIKWSTASENNSMHFEVESSVDAFNWKVIAVVDAAQFSTSLIDYAILHEGAAREKNYYRLKQVDTDGAYEYYSIIYSDCGSDLDGAPIIFPNPSKNNFTIDFGGSGMKGIVQLTLVSMEGKEISNRQLNLGEGVSTFQINNLELQPGLYLIKMTDVTGKLFIIKHRFN